MGPYRRLFTETGRQRAAQPKPRTTIVVAWRTDKDRHTYVWDADGCVVTGGLEQAEEPPKLFPIEPAEFKPAAQLVT